MNENTLAWKITQTSETTKLSTSKINSFHLLSAHLVSIMKFGFGSLRNVCVLLRSVAFYSRCRGAQHLCNVHLQVLATAAVRNTVSDHLSLCFPPLSPHGADTHQLIWHFFLPVSHRSSYTWMWGLPLEDKDCPRTRTNIGWLVAGVDRPLWDSGQTWPDSLGWAIIELQWRLYYFRVR